jgi:hypothetical protein
LISIKFKVSAKVSVRESYREREIANELSSPVVRLRVLTAQ